MTFRRRIQDKIVRDAVQGPHFAAKSTSGRFSLLNIGDTVQINRTKEVAVIVGQNEFEDYILEGHDPKWGFPPSALRKLPKHT